MEGCEGQRKEKKKKKRKEKDMERKGAVLEREFVFVVLTNPITHSFNQSILKTPLNSTTIPSHNSSSTRTHTHTHISLTHIHHSNQQQHMSQSSIKSLPHQSSLFFIITQINLFLPSLSLCLMLLNESNSLLQNPSHISLHHPSLSLIMNEFVKCG